MVVPSRHGVDQTGWVKVSDSLCEAVFGFAVVELAPAFVVDYLACVRMGRLFILVVEAYPREDARVALELVDHELQLAAKLLLLCRVGLPLRHRRHVLDDEESELVGGAVEEAGFDFDLVCH